MLATSVRCDSFKRRPMPWFCASGTTASVGLKDAAPVKRIQRGKARDESNANLLSTNRNRRRHPTSPVKPGVSDHMAFLPETGCQLIKCFKVRASPHAKRCHFSQRRTSSCWSRSQSAAPNWRHCAKNSRAPISSSPPPATLWAKPLSRWRPISTEAASTTVPLHWEGKCH